MNIYATYGIHGGAIQTFWSSLIASQSAYEKHKRFFNYKGVFKHWDFVYGISKTVLTDDETKFKSKFISQANRVMIINPKLTTTL